MGDIIKYFIEFFTSNQIKNSRRFTLIFMGIVSFLAIDYLFGLTEFYVNHRKIEQVAKIQELLDNRSLDPVITSKLKQMQVRIVNRRSYSDLSKDLYSLIQSNISSTTNTTSTNTAASPINEESYVKRHTILHIISSGWIFIIAFIVIIASVLSFNMGSAEIIGLLGSGVLLAIGAACFAYLFSFIPTFDDRIWNYVINGLLHGFIVFSTAYLLKKKAEI